MATRTMTKDDIIEFICGIAGIVICLSAIAACIIITLKLTLVPASISILAVTVISLIANMLLYKQSYYSDLQKHHLIIMVVSCFVFTISNVNAVYGMTSSFLINGCENISNAVVLDVEASSDSFKTIVCELESKDRYTLRIRNQATIVEGDTLDIRYSDDSAHAYPAEYNIDMTLYDLLKGDVLMKEGTIG